MDHGGPKRPWSTTQHHGPVRAPGPLLVHLDPAWSTLCNHTPEIAAKPDQGGPGGPLGPWSWVWTRSTVGLFLHFADDIGTKLSGIDGWILLMGTASKMLQMAFEPVNERLDDQDTRHQGTSSQLHQSIQAEGSAAMARDEEIGRELLDQRAQNQQALLEYCQALKEVIQELRASKEERRQQEGRIAELSELVISLNAWVKGKGKRSDPTLEPSATAVRRGNGDNRPPPPQQAAPGAPGDGDSDDDDNEGQEKGRQDEIPARKGKGPEENQEEEEATWDELQFSQALGKAIGDTTKRPAQPPPEYEHAKHQDVRFWLTACKDFFDHNLYQWQDEADLF